ncbi:MULTISPECIES: diacylglycerol kinase family protein [unclassified Kitasatospora]|uniref:diacylglycerol/lipid kinase family protein n=1 Tax=unclassified Kitasatospora TaxID=2633591 RepID=UPI00070EF00B|nr:MULTISPECIES: diacylglycerol kinase family protein [unclassified Kitasatospora]KQV23783.1 diacylglycerol kinase [Kitasatospora sp. Root107]KRB67504.1 diacylglycerol kinase [Kitasatospora sp. Root187]
MRALLVVNPKATTTSGRTRDVLTHALRSDLALEVAHTEYRGHARDLARDAAERGLDLVVSLGGDGTVNEIVNGLLTHGPSDRVPRLAVVPGGSTNVFARTLGLPNDPVEATGALLDALEHRRERAVSLGKAMTEGLPDRWFTFTAGLGFDAGVVGRVEAQRRAGRKSTHGLYVSQALRHYVTEREHRRNGPITLELNGQESVPGLVLAIISNTSPWTFLGNRPVFPSPSASFDSDLDIFGITRMTAFGTARTVRQILRSHMPADSATGPVGPTGKHLVSYHDVRHFTLVSQEPAPFQVDGDHLGDRSRVSFTGVRRALRVIV